ncbi:hypothetical protein C2R22_02785 [Salinigranum rubrum]|uniref:Uncharacterized protein n=1 Tax=Salinigranum rubrum TaxID=755307 RepID=A0A2I8VFM5_9EURY|nr:hypothetical protein [Salinigranum rubrum]AUV80715.1 hypothetical protein C2R22_02785 [Salinigranum rubrum]
MAEAALIFALALVVGAPLVLYLLVQGETRGRTEMNRADAEAYARERASERYGDGADDGTRE